MATPSQFDNDTQQLTRDHLNAFIVRMGAALKSETGKLLEVGPQDRSLVRENFGNYEFHTFDIVDTYNPTIVGDLTKFNPQIPDGEYDCVVCLEVLEHTLNPFDAVKELRRILKHGGYLMVSAPLNWRIHGPIPDCWRFTEHGWKSLLRDFEILEWDILESPGRELFPLKYNILAKCDKFKSTSDKDLHFRRI